jgi:hypothetical protein
LRRLNCGVHLGSSRKQNFGQRFVSCGIEDWKKIAGRLVPAAAKVISDLDALRLSGNTHLRPQIFAARDRGL